jgi:flagellar biogenesis protein FliO
MRSARALAALVACTGIALAAFAAPEDEFVATPQPNIELLPAPAAPPPREVAPERENGAQGDDAEIVEGQPEGPEETGPETAAPPPAIPPAPPTPAADTGAEPDYFDRHIAEFNSDAGETGDNPAAGTAQSASEAGGIVYVLQVIFSLVMLCGVIIVGGWALRRLGRNTPLLAGPSLGTVMGRVYLTPRASLHYVRTGGRVLVIGITQRGIQPVAEFDADTFDAAQEDQPAATPAAAGGPADFLAQLRGQAGKRNATPGGAEGDDLANLRGEIQQLQEYLRSRPRDVEE